VCGYVCGYVGMCVVVCAGCALPIKAIDRTGQDLPVYPSIHPSICHRSSVGKSSGRVVVVVDVADVAVVV
jgi:hypothetical protein